MGGKWNEKRNLVSNLRLNLKLNSKKFLHKFIDEKTLGPVFYWGNKFIVHIFSPVANLRSPRDNSALTVLRAHRNSYCDLDVELRLTASSSKQLILIQHRGRSNYFYGLLKQLVRCYP